MITITLSDELAESLRSCAASHQMTPEEFAVRTLQDATSRGLTAASESWSILNARRVELIRRKFDAGLSDDENLELRSLQAAADRHLEESDQRRLRWIADLEAIARGLQTPDEA